MPSLLCRFAQNGDIQFDTTSDQITNQLKRVLAGSYREFSNETWVEPKMHAVWHEVSTLPTLPTYPPIFVDTRIRQVNELANLSVYQPDKNRFILSFYDCAYASLDLAQSPYRLEVSILDRYANSMAFEDILFTTLAAPLRRLGIYLAHAFAAVPPDTQCAVLLVGPSHSGKTTTGLNLLLNRWRLLANDVVALQHDINGVYAYPTPNLFTIRPKTFSLLPKLQRLVDHIPHSGISFTSDSLIHGRWGAPMMVQVIFSPSIRPFPDTQIRPLPKTVSIGSLMEESLDTWDQSMLNGHAQFMTDLVSQAQTFSVAVGSDMDQIPHEISRSFSLSYHQ